MQIFCSSFHPSKFVSLALIMLPDWLYQTCYWMSLGFATHTHTHQLDRGIANTDVCRTKVNYLQPIVTYLWWKSFTIIVWQVVIIHKVPNETERRTNNFRLCHAQHIAFHLPRRHCTHPSLAVRHMHPWNAISEYWPKSYRTSLPLSLSLSTPRNSLLFFLLVYHSSVRSLFCAVFPIVWRTLAPIGCT